MVERPEKARRARALRLALETAVVELDDNGVPAFPRKGGMLSPTDGCSLLTLVKKGDAAWADWRPSTKRLKSLVGDSGYSFNDGLQSCCKSWNGRVNDLYRGIRKCTTKAYV